MPRDIVIPVEMGAPLQVREFATLGDYQAVVGGYSKALDVQEIGTTIYANEEGSRHQLPFNPRATLFWRHWQPTARNSQMLVGDVVHIGIPDEDGETTDLPSALEFVLLHDGKFRVEVKTKGGLKWYRNDLEIPALRV